MTTQTKKYIGLADIVGLRFQCKNEKCHAALHLDVDKINKTSIIEMCPNCNQGWARIGSGHGYGGTTHDELISKFLEAVKNLQNAPFGFSIMLELAPEKEINADLH